MFTSPGSPLNTNNIHTRHQLAIIQSFIDDFNANSFILKMFISIDSGDVIASTRNE